MRNYRLYASMDVQETNTCSTYKLPVNFLVHQLGNKSVSQCIYRQSTSHAINFDETKHMVTLVFSDSNILFKLCDFIKIHCETCALICKSINFSVF